MCGKYDAPRPSGRCSRGARLAQRLRTKDNQCLTITVNRDRLKGKPTPLYGLSAGKALHRIHPPSRTKTLPEIGRGNFLHRTKRVYKTASANTAPKTGGPSAWLVIRSKAKTSALTAPTDPPSRSLSGRGWRQGTQTSRSWLPDPVKMPEQKHPASRPVSGRLYGG